MHYFKALSYALALASAVLAAPSDTSDANPYIGKTPFANKGYALKLEETIAYFNEQGDSLNAARTHTIADIPGLISDTLEAQTVTGEKQLLQIAVYNLPDHNCSAKASAGELVLADDGLNKYKKYINDIATELQTESAQQLSFALVIEPNSLGNIVTNLDVPKCAGAADAYKEGIAYAIAKLQIPNVALYIDAAHGGWLGWDDNLGPAAALFTKVLEGAKKLVPTTTVCGLAINVSNYNQYIAVAHENYTEFSNSWDKWHYMNSLVPHLEENGYPAHFIVDQGHSGRSAIRTSWSQWCNICNAGFGTHPTTDQAILNNTYVDSIVWVKPGGEPDGTSDTNAMRFNETCQSPVAHIPAPEAGDWFNNFVINLVTNAEPPLEPTYL
ncbi:unnamed protein product [Cyclocybe aegerita]|uniref:Glucanase n=1 Tax=Cyclocybe aegerita TaxID=1973307 RepID=A0A8S0WEW2_CYCAE|nr:unnamed protein product [Cyclocybe aegerita]